MSFLDLFLIFMAIGVGFWAASFVLTLVWCVVFGFLMLVYRTCRWLYEQATGR